jgi:hypothetical protein
MVMFKIHTAGLSGWFPFASQEGERAVSTAGYIARSVGTTPVSNLYFPSYIKNTVNNGLGLKLSLYDMSYDVATSSFQRMEDVTYPWGDKDESNINGESQYPLSKGYTQFDSKAPRLYYPDIKFNVVCYAYAKMQKGNDSNFNKWYSFNTTGDLIKNNKYMELFQNQRGLSLNFQPSNYASEGNRVLWMPTELTNDLLNNNRNGYAIKNLYINNYIFFNGQVFDKSGRSVWSYCSTDKDTARGGGLLNRLGKGQISAYDDNNYKVTSWTKGMYPNEKEYGSFYKQSFSLYDDVDITNNFVCWLDENYVPNHNVKLSGSWHQMNSSEFNSMAAALGDSYSLTTVRDPAVYMNHLEVPTIWWSLSETAIKKFIGVI